MNYSPQQPPSQVLLAPPCRFQDQSQASIPCISASDRRCTYKHRCRLRPTIAFMTLEISVLRDLVVLAIGMKEDDLPTDALPAETYKLRRFLGV